MPDHSLTLGNEVDTFCLRKIPLLLYNRTHLNFAYSKAYLIVHDLHESKAYTQTLAALHINDSQLVLLTTYTGDFHPPNTNPSVHTDALLHTYAYAETAGTRQLTAYGHCYTNPFRLTSPVLRLGVCVTCYILTRKFHVQMEVRASEYILKLKKVCAVSCVCMSVTDLQSALSA